MTGDGADAPTHATADEPAVDTGADTRADIGSDPGGNPADDGAATGTELELEQAVAFGVDGFDPDDPWNAVLYLEGEHKATVLPLTPTHLDHLVPQLEEVRQGQRSALGVPLHDDPARGGGIRRGTTHDEASGRQGLQRVAHAARVATGSEPVARMWRESLRGRIALIVAVAAFFLAAMLLGLLA